MEDGSILRKIFGLTGRETQVAELLASGASNAEIAERLVLSVETVRTHVAHVLQKMRIRSRHQVGNVWEAARRTSAAKDHPPGD